MLVAHKHVDEKYAHYFFNIYPAYFNAIIGSIVKLLRDLEIPPTSSSRLLFQNLRTAHLYEAILKGKDVCLKSFVDSPKNVVLAMPLLHVLNVQLDNC